MLRLPFICLGAERADEWLGFYENFRGPGERAGFRANNRVVRI